MESQAPPPGCGAGGGRMAPRGGASHSRRRGGGKPTATTYSIIRAPISADGRVPPVGKPPATEDRSRARRAPTHSSTLPIRRVLLPARPHGNAGTDIKVRPERRSLVHRSSW
ncbi:unnamed protein product [Gadus morhua 'NCC']